MGRVPRITALTNNILKVRKHVGSKSIQQPNINNGINSKATIFSWSINIFLGNSRAEAL